MTDLVKRLRAGGPFSQPWHVRILNEAADALEEKDREIERLRDENAVDRAEAQGHIEHLDRENQRLLADLQACRNKLKASGRAKLREEVERLRAAYELVQKDCVNLTEKVIPNLRQELGGYIREDGRKARANAELLAQIERLRAESAAFEQAWKDACVRAEQVAEDLAVAAGRAEYLEKRLQAMGEPL